MNSGVVRTALIVIGILIESIRRELIEAIVFILLNFILYPNGFDWNILQFELEFIFFMVFAFISVDALVGIVACGLSVEFSVDL